MRSPAESDCEQLLKNLVHDLRQPLGNIETSVYYLDLIAGDPHVREQIGAIAHQVERAAALLSEAVAELHRRQTTLVATAAQACPLEV